MGTDLMPLSLVAKLLGALALCFGLLVAAAWVLRKHWPSLNRVLDATKREEKGLQILQTRGLGPGAALHLLEVDGARLLVLQSKERSDVIWSRDDEKLLNQAYDGAGLGAEPAHGQGPAAPARAATPVPSAYAAYAAEAEADAAMGEGEWEPEAKATLDALAASVLGPGVLAGPVAFQTPPVAAPVESPSLAAPRMDAQALQQRHDRTLTLQRERQRRYRERHRHLAQAQGVLLFPGPTGTRR